MSIRRIVFCVLASVAPAAAFAQEAFITQISAGPVVIDLPSTPRTASVEATIASLDLTIPRIFADTSIDLSAYPLIAPATTGPIASATSIGNNNSTLIFQTGVHAASIAQTGNYNIAQIMQSGAGNRASIYQAGNQRSAMVTQSGRNNTALIVQRN